MMHHPFLCRKRKTIRTKYHTFALFASFFAEIAPPRSGMSAPVSRSSFDGGGKIRFFCAVRIAKYPERGYIPQSIFDALFPARVGEDPASGQNR
jgi:hypothetical protein